MGNIVKWDFNENIELSIINLHIGGVLLIEFFNNNSFVASCGYDNTIRVWNIKKKQQEYLFQQQTLIKSIAITKNNKYIVAYSNRDIFVRVWYIKKIIC